MRQRNIALWLALTCFLMFGMATSPARAQSPADLDAVDSYRLALLKLKGHLGIARELLQLRRPGAAYHLQRAARDIYRSVAPELEARNAPLSVDTLAQLDQATEAAPQAALAIIDLAAAAIDGSFAQTGAIDTNSALALSAALLRESVDLYAEAVENNEVVDIRAYRTGRGYVVQAETLVRHSSGLRDRPGLDALLAVVVLIRQAWPGVNPPPIVLSPGDVAGRLQEAMAAMERLR